MSNNVISNRTYRDKYRQAMLDHTLRRALVAEAVCEVDRSDNMRILNPYGSEITAQITALTGTYTVSDFTTTDDTLTVDVEVKAPEHIYDFESVLSRFDLFESRFNEQIYKVKDVIDSFVINSLTDAGTGAYTTPAGGFATAANVSKIFADLIAKVSGFADAYKGLFVIVENTDIGGIIQAQATNGYSYADSALNNGLLTRYMGVEIYVTRAGTFANTSYGGHTFTNSGHRVFGVKKVATYAAPRGVRFEEKGVSGKTGMEVVTYGYCGFKLWAVKTDLVVDITLA